MPSYEYLVSAFGSSGTPIAGPILNKTWHHVTRQVVHQLREWDTHLSP